MFLSLTPPEIFDILCASVSAFDKLLQVSLAVFSVQFIVKIVVMDRLSNSDHFLRFPVAILVKLPIGQCFINEKLILEAFPFKAKYLG